MSKKTQKQHVATAAESIMATLNGVGRDGRKALLGEQAGVSNLKPAAPLIAHIARQTSANFMTQMEQKHLSDADVLELRKAYLIQMDVYKTLLGLANEWNHTNDEVMFNNQRLTMASAPNAEDESVDLEAPTEDDKATDAANATSA